MNVESEQSNVLSAVKTTGHWARLCINNKIFCVFIGNLYQQQLYAASATCNP